MSISIEQLLNIPGVAVLKTEISEREISIHVKIESNYTRCHRCGEKATEYYCDGEMLRLRHLPIFERPVYLYLLAGREKRTVTAFLQSIPESLRATARGGLHRHV